MDLGSLTGGLIRMRMSDDDYATAYDRFERHERDWVPTLRIAYVGTAAVCNVFATFAAYVVLKNRSNLAPSYSNALLKNLVILGAYANYICIVFQPDAILPDLLVYDIGPFGLSYVTTHLKSVVFVCIGCVFIANILYTFFYNFLTLTRIDKNIDANKMNLTYKIGSLIYVVVLAVVGTMALNFEQRRDERDATAIDPRLGRLFEVYKVAIFDLTTPGFQILLDMGIILLIVFTFITPYCFLKLVQAYRNNKKILSKSTLSQQRQANVFLLIAGLVFFYHFSIPCSIIIGLFVLQFDLSMIPLTAAFFCLVSLSAVSYAIVTVALVPRFRRGLLKIVLCRKVSLVRKNMRRVTSTSRRTTVAIPI